MPRSPAKSLTSTVASPLDTEPRSTAYIAVKSGPELVTCQPSSRVGPHPPMATGQATHPWT